MRILLAVLLLISTAAFAGEPSAADFKQQFWSEASPEFAITEVPEKWADHGAIIIAQEFIYRNEYAKANKLLNIETSHVRMKLQDASSVDAYSEFYYSEEYYPERGYGGKGKTYVGFKVIKEDGSSSEVNLSQAVVVSESEWEIEKKIAIPNLEKGDIIDFYYATVETFNVLSHFVFNPVIAQLNDEYPLMFQRFVFETEKYFFINFGSMNGAPELKRSPDSNKKLDRFVVENGMQEPNDGMLWEYGYRTYPAIKFQVIYAKKGEASLIPAFLGEPGVVKNNVGEKDILAFLENWWSADPDEEEETYKAFKRYLRYNGLTNYGKKQKLEEFYYYLRYQNSLRQQPGNLLESEPYGNLEIVSILANYMTLEEIEFELLLAVGRTLGSLEDLVIKEEIEFIIKSDGKYFHDLDDHSLYGDISGQFEAAEAWQINVTDPVSQWKAEKYTLGFSPQTDNNVHGELQVSLDEADPLKLRIKRRNVFNGKSRGRVMWNLLLFEEYHNEDRQKYMLRYRPMDVSEEEGVDKEEKRMEALEAIINNDFDLEIDEVHDFEIHCNGRYPGTDSLDFTEDFTTPGLMKRAGNNLLLQAGMLIGSQIEIGEEERNRESDVYMPYARSFSYEITVEIPEGYTVEGVDKLNFDVSNETGAFKSQARLEGGKLLISTRKQYNANFETLEDWPKMVEFLEAAYSFTQQRVLLKKN